MGNVGQSMSVQPLLPIGENTLGKEIMQIHRYVFLPIMRPLQLVNRLFRLVIEKTRSFRYKFNHETLMQTISI